MDTAPRYVLIAGLPCSGKSTLIRSLCDGDLAHVVQELGLVGMADAVTRTAYQMNGGARWKAGVLNLIHYDLLRPLRETHISDYETDPFFPLLPDTAPEMVVHVDPDPDVVQDMLSDRIRRRRFSVRHVLRPFDENRRLQFLGELGKRYADRDWLNDRVGRWRSFALARFSCPHVVVHHHGFRRPDWRDYVRVRHITEQLEKLFRSCGSFSG